MATYDQSDRVQQVWAFGGGKGGVGKSVVCSSVAVELASRGHRVTVLDADLGGANLHTLLGLRFAEKTLDDFVSGRCGELADVRLSTPVEGLRIISGAGGVLKSAHLEAGARRRLIQAFFELDDDILLIDLGAGTHYSTLDFFNVAGEGLVVTGPEPTAIQNAYAFLKAVMFRRLHQGLGAEAEIRSLVDRALLPRGADRLSSMESVLAALEELDPALRDRAQGIISDARVHLVVNQARPSAVRRVVKALSMVSRRYLDLEPALLAAVPPDPAVHAAVRAMVPVRDKQPNGPFCKSIEALVDTLLAQARPSMAAEAIAWMPEVTLAPEVSTPEATAPPSSPLPEQAQEPPVERESEASAMPEPIPEAAPEAADDEVPVAQPALEHQPSSRPEPVSARPVALDEHPTPPPPSVMSPPTHTPSPARAPTPIPEVPGLPAEIVAALMRHQGTSAAPPPPPPALDPWAEAEPGQ